MIKVVIGAAVAAVAMLVLSYIVHATPVAGLGHGAIPAEQAVRLQSAHNLYLAETGTYRVPDPNTAAQLGLYAQGPVSTIHYYVGGEANSAIASMRLIYALILHFLVAGAIGMAMLGLGRAVGFGDRARLATIFAFAASGLVHLGRPIWLYHDWGNAIYAFLTDGFILAAGAVIVAWFLPRERERAPREAPTDV